MFPKLILPTDSRKYTGNITKKERKTRISFQVAIRSGENKYFKTFDSYDESFHDLRCKNLELGLPIKNLIWEHEDHLELVLTQNKTCKVSKGLENTVLQPYLWWYHQGHAVTDRRLQTKLHSLLLGNLIPPNFKVIHLNNDTLDYRYENLQIVPVRRSSRRRAPGIFLRKGSWVGKYGEEEVAFNIAEFGYDEAKNEALRWLDQYLRTE
jgi:hypothetical protein